MASAPLEGRRTTYGGTNEAEIWAKKDIETAKTKAGLAAARKRIAADLERLTRTTHQCSPTAMFTRYDAGKAQFTRLRKPQNLDPERQFRAMQRNLALETARANGTAGLLVHDSDVAALLAAEEALLTGRRRLGAAKTKYKDSVSELFSAGQCGDDSGPPKSTNEATYCDTDALKDERRLILEPDNMLNHRKKNGFTEFIEIKAMQKRLKQSRD